MRLRSAFLVLLLLPFVSVGCATLEGLAALRHVQFAIDSIEQTRLAGVRIDQAGSYEDIGALGAAQIGVAAAQGRLPLSFVMQLGAENPSENPVAAQLVQLDWILLLDDTETIRGVFNDDRTIPPGQRVSLPLAMELDLMQFFQQSLPSLINLALAVAGESEQQVALRARPTIRTPLGPITYPGEITIRHTVRG
jgi:hypothetical protein